MKSLFNTILYLFLWLLTLLPLPVLYLLSDMLYFVAYYIVGYRKNVVLNNLRNAFPEKDQKELVRITRKFYHHLCDFLIESVKTMHMSKKQFLKRCRYLNVDYMNSLFDKGKDVTLISGHYGNWEWMNYCPQLLKHKLLVIYKPLKNRMADKVIRDLRSKFGIIPVPKKEIYKEVLKFRSDEIRTITWFLGDQRPPGTNHYWTTFLNQDTAFFQGAEKIARKLNHAVVFLHTRKLKRGHYEYEFIPLFDNGAITGENEITEKQTRTLEKNIMNEPYLWLWSHKRWKTIRPRQS